MSKQRLVITAVLAGQSQSAVARRYGVSQGWISKLMTRWRLEGEAAFEPRSRRPKTSPTATRLETVELVIALRHRLSAAGLDAGADTIGWHLTHSHQITLNRATIHRVLTRHGLVEAEPQKRPKSSYLHFPAEQANECWQSDFTHYRLSTPVMLARHYGVGTRSHQAAAGAGMGAIRHPRTESPETKSHSSRHGSHVILASCSRNPGVLSCSSRIDPARHGQEYSYRSTSPEPAPQPLWLDRRESVSSVRMPFDSGDVRAQSRTTLRAMLKNCSSAPEPRSMSIRSSG